MTGVRLAYIVSRFPGLSETFILREMNGLRSKGWDIALYPLIVQDEKVIHDSVESWMVQVRRIPWVSVELIISNLKWLFSHPRLYLSLLVRVVWENKANLNFLARAVLLFPRAVLMSDRMRGEKVGHIHAHYSTHPALVAWIIHRLTGISYSITVHAHDIFVRRDMLHTKMSEAAFIVAISEFNKQFLSHHLGEWVTEKTHIVHCGIDPALYKPKNGVSQLRVKFNITSVGGLRPYKGMSYLVRAVALLNNRNVPVYCRIVGEGEERSKLAALILNLKVGLEVELTGAKTQIEVAEILTRTDCYVQPSVITENGKMEGIPVALMEALASQLPVIASELSGIPELVVPDQTGYLVPPANAAALADAIEHVYRNPSEALQRSRDGRQHVLNEFSLETSVNRLSSLFEQITRWAT